MSLIKKKRILLEKEFKDNLTKLNSSLDSFKYSFHKCTIIGLKDEYLEEELEAFEALTARFARTSDVFTQKILLTLFILLKEDPKGFIDRANIAEKLNIIPNSLELQEIRVLRNEIAHEYLMRNVSDIFEDILQYSSKLDTIINQALEYIKNNF